MSTIRSDALRSAPDQFCFPQLTAPAPMLLGEVLVRPDVCGLLVQLPCSTDDAAGLAPRARALQGYLFAQALAQQDASLLRACMELVPCPAEPGESPSRRSLADFSRLPTSWGREKAAAALFTSAVTQSEDRLRYPALRHAFSALAGPDGVQSLLEEAVDERTAACFLQRADYYMTDVDERQELGLDLPAPLSPADFEALLSLWSSVFSRCL